MNRPALRLLIGLLLLPLGCGSPTGLDFLQPSELCSDHPDDAIATFEDTNLLVEVRAALGITPGSTSSTMGSPSRIGSTGGFGPPDVTCGLASRLFLLEAGSAGIVSLAGIQNLTSLTSLGLNRNSITDISPLSGLTSLRFLGLSANSITDISPLSGLTSLSFLELDSNTNLSNIQPLLDNTGLGPGDQVFLTNTNVGCTDVAALQAKGLTVESDCR